MSYNARGREDVYGKGFQKAKRQAIARSGAKCQFCGLRRAEEGHHWAWPDYPSDEEVQGHDITALCKTCHELATVLRDWVKRKHADFDQIEKEIRTSNSFYEKREAFSYWLFPEEDGGEEEAAYLRSWNVREIADIPPPSPSWTSEPSEFQGAGNSSPQSHLSVKDQLEDFQFQLDIMKDLRSSLERQMDRMENGESLYSPSAQEDAKFIAQEAFIEGNADRYELETEYKEIGRRMSRIIYQMKRLRKGKKKRTKKPNACGAYLSFLFFIFFAFSLSIMLAKLGW